MGSPEGVLSGRSQGRGVDDVHGLLVSQGRVQHAAVGRERQTLHAFPGVERGDVAAGKTGDDDRTRAIRIPVQPVALDSVAEEYVASRGVHHHLVEAGELCERGGPGDTGGTDAARGEREQAERRKHGTRERGHGRTHPYSWRKGGRSGEYCRSGREGSIEER